MATARDYTELHAWQLADQARTEVTKLTDAPAFRAHLDLRTQLRRAIESACANMAEGFARYKPKDHARFLRIAKGSLSETLEHISSAVARGLIDEEHAERIRSLVKRSRGACTRLIVYLESAEEPK